MSTEDHHQPPAEPRPDDPAGSRPRHDPDSVLPSGKGPLLGPGNLTSPQAAALRTEPAAPLPDAAEATSDAGEPIAPPHVARFQFLFGVLIAVGAAAVVLFVASLLHGDGSGSTTTAAGDGWAAWAPTSKSSNSVPQQIAAHVAPRYRLDQGQQAVLVDGGPLTVASLPLTVAVKAPAAQGGGISLLENKKSVLYRFCGLGDKCGLIGKRSIERHLLLRREALELALYSFHYTDADQVVVFMPPPAGSKTGQSGNALFFQRGTLARQLHQPLDSTLTDEVPRPSAIDRSADRLIVETQTRPAYFNFTLQQANQDNRAYLVLAPLTAAQLTAPAPKPTPATGKPA